MAFSKYNKDRPFLVVIRRLVRSTKMPAKHAVPMNTEEEVIMVDRVTNTHLHSAFVIIDVLQNKIVKNRTERPDDEIVSMYLKSYSEYVADGIQTWVKRLLQTSDNNQVQEFLKTLQEEIDKE